MPTLPQTEAHLVGPTVDTNQELSVPLFRQESHEIPVLPSQVRLRAAKPRPMTHKSDHQLRSRKATVLTRQSNLSPAQAGGGYDTSIWGVSDPFTQDTPGHGSHLAEWRPQSMVVPVAAGVLIGWLVARYV